MKVAVIDPSLFTIPYDGALCDALGREGCAVERPSAARERDEMAGASALKPFFYISASASSRCCRSGPSAW